MRKYYRQIAKARMKAMGIDRINRKMRRVNGKGIKLWRAFVFGEYAEHGAAALRSQGIRNKRKIRRVAQ